MRRLTEEPAGLASGHDAAEAEVHLAGQRFE